MRLTYSHGSHGTKEFSTEATHVVIGRRGGGTNLDLSPDQSVSRRHACITFENGEYYVEDLNSRNGTFVNEKKITVKTPLSQGDRVHIGDTTLMVEFERLAEREKEPQILGVGVSKEPPGMVNVTACFQVERPPFDVSPSVEAAKDVVSATELRLALYYKMVMALGEEGDFDARLQTVVERALEAIPTAKRSTLLVKERNSNRLLLSAHAPRETEPAVSLTLAKRAMSQREAINWCAESGTATGSGVRSDSLLLYRLSSGIYAPLVWKDEIQGVFCMDSGEALTPFGEEDLRLLTAIANHVAMSLANHYLQEQVQSEAAIRSNLMRQFSPRVAEKLIARRTIHLGGERTEGTILCSDIRGFTALTARMSPSEVVAMLNSYFSELTPIIFNCDGTVDKYVGDSILAVFGSPEHDENQCEKAVRAALEMQHKVGELNQDRAKQGQVTCQMGIGIHCGELLHGFIGSPDKMEFTVIGDVVNRATRVCDGADRGEVIISRQVYRRVYWLVDVKPTTTKPKHPGEGELEAYKVLGLKKG